MRHGSRKHLSKLPAMIRGQPGIRFSPALTRVGGEAEGQPLKPTPHQRLLERFLLFAEIHGCDIPSERAELRSLNEQHQEAICKSVGLLGRRQIPLQFVGRDVPDD